MRGKHKILLRQLDEKVEGYKSAATIEVPDNGWIHTIRTTLKITLEQFGNRLNKTKQGVRKMEESEAAGSISLNSLRKAGATLGLQLVYGFVPMDGSFEKMVENRARQLATEIVMRTDTNMMLEDQKLPDDKLNQAIEDLTIELINDMPKSLWD